MDHRPDPAADSDGFVAALGSSLRRTVAEHQTLRQLLRSSTVVTARRTAARTARRLAPETADRLIAQLKGTTPLLSGLPEQVCAQVRTRSAALRASAALTVAAVVGGGLVGAAPSALAEAGTARAAAQVLTQAASTPPGSDDAASAEGPSSGPAIYPRPQRERTQGTPVTRPARVALAVAPHADPGALAALRAVLVAAGVQRIDTVSPDSDPRPGALTIYLGGAAEGATGGTDRALRSLAGAGQPALSPTGLPAGGYVLGTGTIGPIGTAGAVGTVGAPLANSARSATAATGATGSLDATGARPKAGAAGGAGAGAGAAGGAGAGVAVLAGVDADGTYNAVQSFRQILGAGGALPALSVQDWPAAPVRGVVEGFYGTPWTTQQTTDMIDFLGQTKQNHLLYAPGDDPYRDVLWREPYPADQQAELRTLAARAALDHVTLGYSLSPAASLCYTSRQDQDALVAKLEQLWGLGLRSFQLDFSQATFSHWHCNADAVRYGHGPQAAAQAQADVVAVVLHRFLARHPGADPLTVLPSEYHETGATPYRTALAQALDGSVQVAWTGAGVEPATITSDDLTTAQQTLGHPLLTEDNYPVNDSAQDRLYLGAYQGRAPALTSGTAGVLVNAMQQPVASRIPLFTAADFAWNPLAYQPDASWQAAVSALAGATSYGAGTARVGAATPTEQASAEQARAALAALAGNSASSPLGQQESAYLRPLLNAFWDTFEPASPQAHATTPAATAARSKAAAQLRAAFTTMAQATDNLAGIANGQLLAEDSAWVQELAQYGRAGQAAVDMLAAQRAGNGAAAWNQRGVLRQELGRLQDSGVTLGSGVLDTFLDRALKAADSWTGVDGDQLTPTSSMGTAQDHDPALMADGDPNTYYWSGSPAQAGDTVGVDLGSDAPVRTVHILMGGPDGDVAQGDILQDAILEYATDDSGWVQVGHYHGQGEIDATLPAGTVARYLRLRAGSAQDSAVAVREFSVTTPDATAMTATGPAAVAGAPVSNAVDGTLDTPYQAAAAPQPGDALTVTLGQTRPLSRVVVLTDGSVHTPGWVEVRSAAQGWTRLGAIASGGYTELAADPKLHVDAIRLLWSGAPGSRPPVVYQVVPWYADTPAATLQLGAQSVDLQAGGAPVALPGVLQAQDVGGAVGTVAAQLPPTAKGVTVTGTGPVALPRGGSTGVPLSFAAAANTPTGSYTAHVVFTVGGRTATQDVTVHVYPRTGGPDLALTGTASSSADETSDFPADNAVDGDPTTRWSSPAQDDEWVQVRLAAPATLGEVVLHWQDAYAARYEIQTSIDGVHWATAATVASGHGGDETVRFGAVTAQYVRMQGLARATRFGYSLWGMEVYAVVPQAPAPTPTPSGPGPNPSGPPIAPPATPTPDPGKTDTPSPTATS